MNRRIPHEPVLKPVPPADIDDLYVERLLHVQPAGVERIVRLVEPLSGAVGGGSGCNSAESEVSLEPVSHDDLACNQRHHLVFFVRKRGTHRKCGESGELPGQPAGQTGKIVGAASARQGDPDLRSATALFALCT